MKPKEEQILGQMDGAGDRQLGRAYPWLIYRGYDYVRGYLIGWLWGKPIMYVYKKL